MRDFKNMKRQRGRNRSSGSGGGGGGKPQQNANRAFDSNGPDNVKIRGHAQHVFEKYQQLARDAFSSGDRVLAENYLQHADHYFRVLRTIQPQRSPSEILGRDVLASGLDIDFEEEFEPADETAESTTDAAPEMNGSGETPRTEGRRDEPRYGEGRRDGYERDNRYDNRREGGDNGYRDRQDQPRDRGEFRDRPDRGGDNRQERPYDNRSGENRPVDNRPVDNRPVDSRPVDSRPVDNRAGENRPNDNRYGEPRQDRYEGRRDNRRFEGRRDERPFNRDNRYDERPADAPRADPLAVVALEAAQPFPSAASEAQPSTVLRSEDGGMSEAPAFLQSAGGEEGERKPRPRRRRTPRSFEAGDAAPVTEAGDA